MSLVFQRIMPGYNFQEKSTSPNNIMHLHVWEEYKNRCIEKISHGDDLYMIVWCDKEDLPKEVKYGNKSVQSLPKHSSYVDADEQTLKKYNEWLNHKNKIVMEDHRKKYEKKLIIMRQIEAQVMSKFNLKLERLRLLYSLVGYDNYISCLSLLLKNFRNIFKKDLQNTLISFLNSDKKRNPFSFYEWRLLKEYTSL